MPDEHQDRRPQQSARAEHGVQRAAVSGLETLGAAWPAAGWSRHAAVGRAPHLPLLLSGILAADAVSCWIHLQDALFSSLATSNLMDAADFAQSNSNGEALMGLTSVGSLLQQPNPLQQLQALQAHHLVRCTTPG